MSYDLHLINQIVEFVTAFLGVWGNVGVQCSFMC